MSEKKRKAQAEVNDQPSLKRVPVPGPNQTIIVRHLRGSSLTMPVIASSPGTSLSSSLEFQAYASSTGSRSELLLHSSDHPTIDFTATEGGTYADSHVKHYVAVYDPVSRQLAVVAAKKMTVRGTVRQAGSTEAEEAPIQATSNYASRTELTHSFGTKKSKKLVQSRAENVLYSRDAGSNAANPLSEALLSSMPEAEDLPMTADGRILDRAATIQAAKPLPIPDLTATNVSQAYPLSNLIFPSPFASTLSAMPTSDWLQLFSEGKRVSTSSRFIADHITPTIQAMNAQPSPTSPQSHTLQLLRYIYLLIELARVIKKYRPDKRLPPISKWSTTSRITDFTNLPIPLLNALLKKYCPNGTGPTKYDLTLLHTTILALTLHIPPPSGNLAPGILATELTAIQQDLNIQAEEARHYFRELGCKIEKATEKELKTWGIVQGEKEEEGRQGGKTGKMKFAKLRLPLVFPQVGRGRPLGRK